MEKVIRFTYVALGLIFLAIILVCAFFIGSYYLDGTRQQALYDELAGIAEAQRTTSIPTFGWWS